MEDDDRNKIVNVGEKLTSKFKIVKVGEKLTSKLLLIKT